MGGGPFAAGIGRSFRLRAWPGLRAGKRVLPAPWPARASSRNRWSGSLAMRAVVRLELEARRAMTLADSIELEGIALVHRMGDPGGFQVGGATGRGTGLGSTVPQAKREALTALVYRTSEVVDETRRA